MSKVNFFRTSPFMLDLCKTTKQNVRNMKIFEKIKDWHIIVLFLLAIIGGIYGLFIVFRVLKFISEIL